ncbi:putative repeat protein (TIGR01451 family) [Chryseobacterium defluvii]|uniref:Putative repeat protein (TIGR01451 family) n=1 Tax=Chryseobacterium defluvii TaxID=160396 RepID=A0A840KHW0_9FLAO|nr:DUF11 domain-containing protein [Chryseobacterium defluvii]MBB4807527.1 putative repeat protein (TIGR01451 family) [Chryseobacterium defluvii]
MIGAMFSVLFMKAQTNPSLEMADGDSNPTTNVTNVVGNTTIRLRNNTNNPTASTFATYANPTALNVTYTLSNQQYTQANFAGYNGVVFMGYPNEPILTLMNAFGSTTANTPFTSNGASVGTGIDITANRAVNFFTNVQPLTTAARATNQRWQMADLTLTFSRPVNNPYLQVNALGGVSGVSYSTEFDYLSSNVPVTFSKVSGTTFLNVTSTQILNSATTPDGAAANASRGTVLVSGTGITTLTLRVYVRGAAANAGTNWHAGSNIAGEGYMIGVTAAESNLSVTKTVNNSTPTAGTNVSFTVTATNTGASNNTNVVVNDLLPSGYTYVSSAVSAGTYVSGTGVWTIGNLNAGASATMEIVATVKSSGSYMNTATISGDLIDPDATNNTASITPAPVVPDTDGDGIDNTLDLDDDNDGILDTAEGYCTSQSVYTLNIANTLAGATFGANGGSFNLVYTLTSGPAVASLGTSFNVPFSYSDFTNTVNAQNHTWSAFNTSATEFRIIPNTTLLYTGLPTNNTTTEDQSGASPNTPDSWFRYFLSTNRITQLGTYTTTIGSLPTVTGVSSYSSNTALNLFSTFNAANSGAVLASGYYARMQFQNTTNPSAGAATLPYGVSYGSTYTWNYTAFTNTAGSGAGNAGDRGLITISQNTITYCNHRDTDGDGTPDYLDLDSDGDGCYDAIEGDENVTAAQLNGNGRINSSVDAQGVPVLVNTGGAADVGSDQGQGIGQSTDMTRNDCTDTDVDGYPDWQDLDDDNDGIPDSSECNSNDRITSGTFPTTGGNTNTVAGWTVGGTYAASGPWVSPTGRVNLNTNGLEFRRDVNTVTTLQQSLTGVMGGSSLSLNQMYWFRTAGTETDNGFTFTVSYGGVVYATITSTGTPEPSIVASNGATVNISSLPAVATQVNQSAKTNLIITLPQTGIPSTGNLLFTFTAGPSATQVRDLGMQSVSLVSCRDLDGDGTPDYLDLDSDGDTCYDAIEGDENVTAAQLNGNGSINSSVDSQGVPVLVNTGGAADIGNDQGQGIGYSGNSSLNACIDTDNDGIPNVDDLDDDNDGILDTVECTPTYTVRPVTTASITADKPITSGNAQQLVDGEGAGGSGPGTFPYWYTNISNLPIAFSMNMQASSTIDHIKLYGPWGINEWIKDFAIELYNASNTLLGTESFTTPDQYTGTPVFTFTKEYTNVTRVRFTIISSQGYSSAVPQRASLNEIVFLDLLPLTCDTDGDSIFNHLDLDSDGDGCYDAIEGDENVTAAQLNGNGSINSSVDAQGVPVLVNTGGAADIGSDQGQGAGSSANSAIQDIQCANTFGCSSAMYLSQNNTLYNVNTSSNPFTYPLIGTSTSNYNGIGINPLNGYMYGLINNTNTLIVLNTDGTHITLGPVTGLPTGVIYNAGEIDNLGNYYVKVNTNNNQLYRINLTTMTATLMTLSTSVNLPDLAYNTTTGLLYGVHLGNGQLVSINPGTNVVTTIGTAPGAASFGAMYGSSTGELYGVENAGGFYQFNLTTGQRVLISNAPASSGNDGAHCVTSPIAFSADIAVTKTDGVGTYASGTTTTYTVTVSNAGPFGVLGATVSDPVPAGIPAANVSYTAAVAGGATTSVVGTQTGAINDLVSLPVGGTVTYTVVVTIPLAYSGDLVNTVTVTPPSNITEVNNTNNSATDTDTQAVCYKPAVTAGTVLNTPQGITSLGRAGADTAGNNWPMVRKGAWTVLEAKTKGFVLNRLTSAQITAIPSADLVEGMMVYNTTLDCLQVNTDGTAAGWACFNTQTCPTN